MARSNLAESLEDIFEQPKPRTFNRFDKWRHWLVTHFPTAADWVFAARHVRLWEWFEALVPGIEPRPHAEIWPRGGAKSSTAELGAVYVGQKGTRKFTLYVSGTQGQANKHVQAIAAKFERLGVGRAIGKYGNSLGWRIDLLRVENGYNVLALGLDAAARGVKLEDLRPDLIVLDDVDERHDTEAIIKKKIETITETILPAGSADAAVLFVQNRVHENSIASQIADATADFLLDRECFEEPAVEGLEIQPDEMPDGTRRYRITGGTPTWEGQNLATCERQLNKWGRYAFMREAQHDFAGKESGLWQRDRDIDPFRVRKTDCPELHRVCIAIDPNAGEGGDEAGIMAGGIALIGAKKVDGRLVGGKLHGYLLEDATVGGGPAKWAEEAVAAYKRHEADVMVAEKNNGGDMVAITISTVEGAPRVKLLHASRGKLTRAEPVQKLAEDGRIHHVGVFMALEKELCNWQPGDPSPNRLDAFVWLFTELLLEDRGAFRIAVVG